MTVGQVASVTAGAPVQAPASQAPSQAASGTTSSPATNVTISPQAMAAYQAASGDKDHDGDSS